MFTHLQRRCRFIVSSSSSSLSRVVATTRREYRPMVSQQLTQHLEMLSEFKQAVSLEKDGQYSKSIIKVTEAADIMQAAMGPSSPLLKVLNFQRAQLLKSCGKFDDALDAIPDRSILSVDEAICADQLSTLCRLQKGDVAGAIADATRAVDACEAQHNDNVNINWLSSCYALLGLSNCLRGGDLHEADSYLQAAARWARTPTELLMSVSNLGSLAWVSAEGVFTDPYGASNAHQGTVAVVCPSMLREHYIASALLSDTPSGFYVNAQINDGAAPDLLSKHLPVVDAVAYWEDAINEAQTSASAGPVNIASAMCGVVGQPTAQETLGASGLGADVIAVPSSSATTVKQTEEEKEEMAKGSLDPTTVFQNNLKNHVYATAYVSVLCNLAEGYIWMGQTDKAQEVLSAALQAVEVHNKAIHHNIYRDNPSTSSSSSSSSGDGGGDTGRDRDRDGSVSETETVFMPMQYNSNVDATLGRALSLHALLHHRTGRAVMAEGLYRSAIDKLSHRSVAHDQRFQYELAVAEGLYGLLLHKWDRREKEGRKWTNKALERLASIRNRCSGDKDSSRGIDSSNNGQDGDRARSRDNADSSSSSSNEFMLPYFQYPF